MVSNVNLVASGLPFLAEILVLVESKILATNVYYCRKCLFPSFKNFDWKFGRERRNQTTTSLKSFASMGSIHQSLKDKMLQVSTTYHWLKNG